MQHCLGSPGQICVLSGDGGIGKTATATEFSYFYEDDYSHIFWVDAETSGGCADTFSLIAAILIPGGDVLRDQDGLNALVREALELTEHRWLLVFDNVEMFSNVEQYIPSDLESTQGSVLITTRNSKRLDGLPWPGRCETVAMNAMSLNESRELILCSMEPDLDRHQMHLHRDHGRAGDVSLLVEGLPLAISMIAGYLRESNCSLSEFLEIWKQKQSRSIETTHRPEAGTAGSSVDILWDIGMRELSKQTRDLLDILIFLDPEAIQKDLLVGDHKELPLEFLNSAETNRYAEDRTTMKVFPQH